MVLGILSNAHLLIRVFSEDQNAFVNHFSTYSQYLFEIQSIQI